jgi:hypothetical protein
MLAGEAERMLKEGVREARAVVTPGGAAIAAEDAPPFGARRSPRREKQIAAGPAPAARAKA